MDKNEFFESDDLLDDILGEYGDEAVAEEEIPAEEYGEEEYYEEGYEEEYGEDEAYDEEEYDEPVKKSAAPKRRKRRRWPWVVLAIFLLLVGGAAGAAYYAYGEAMELVDMAYATLDEVELTVDQVKSRDFAAVERSVASIDAKLETIDTTLDEPLWQMAAKVPGYGEDLTRLRVLFGIWDDARDNIMTPALRTLQECPLPDLAEPDLKALLKDSATLETYMDLVLTVVPACERVMDDFYAIPTLYIPQLEEKMQEVRTLIDTVRPFLPLVTDALENAAKPALETLKRAPLEELKLGDRVINRDLILEYLDLAEELVPVAEGYIQRLDELATLPSEELNELIVKVGDKAAELLALYHKGEKYIPLARAFLDHEEEQVYVVAIQNATEIRSTGGFPGNMCLLYMGDGVITISDFMITYDILRSYIDFQTFKIPYVEEQIFFSYVYQPRDAVVNPHFPRVAETWCASPHEYIDKEYKGVISLSPTLMQDFLAITGGSFELSNGVTLNAENVISYLQHDIYTDYFDITERDVFSANTLTDKLFSEAGKAILDMAFDAIKLDTLDDLIDMVDRHIANRSMMFWLKDPEGQAVIAELGADGALNSDPEAPAVGVYFNGCASSKLGWYLNMDVEVGEGSKTGDVMTYPVTVTLENTLTMDEFAVGNPWVLGMDMGNMKPNIYIFAPAGGTVSNFSASNNMMMVPGEYQGLQLGYHFWTYFPLGEKIVITCDVTTAPGVETPPVVSKTPTLQNYR